MRLDGIFSLHYNISLMINFGDFMLLILLQHPFNRSVYLISTEIKDFIRESVSCRGTQGLWSVFNIIYNSALCFPVIMQGEEIWCVYWVLLFLPSQRRIGKTASIEMDKWLLNTDILPAFNPWITFPLETRKKYNFIFQNVKCFDRSS